MSMKPQPIPEIPPEMVRVVRAVFPKGNVYIHLRDTLVQGPQTLSYLLDHRHKSGINRCEYLCIRNNRALKYCQPGNNTHIVPSHLEPAIIMKLTLILKEVFNNGGLLINIQ